MSTTIPALWKHQAEAIERAKTLRNFALFLDIGTGKSRTQVEILRYRYNQEKRIMRTLIFAPLSVCPQWKREFEKFSRIPQEHILVLTGPGKTRTAHLSKLGSNGAIVCTNYEAVQIEHFYQALMAWGPEIIVWDESQKLKAPNTVRFKKMAPLADVATHRYILTGTPILNSPMDLFGQYRMLDGGVQFGKSFFFFRKTYFVDKNAGMPKQKYFPKWEVRQGLLPTFSKIIAATAAQAKKSECLDLPPLLKIEVPVELGKDQTKAYMEMQKQFLTELDGVTSVAEFAMTKSLRMQQILAGFVKGTGEDEYSWVKDNPRMEALVDLLEQCEGQKVIIWTNFRVTYAAIQKEAEKLGRKVEFLTGEQTGNEKQQAIDNFCRGDSDTLVANPAAGGAGINLTEAPIAIYYLRNYSLEQFLQSEGRNYRGGSNMHQKVTHYHIVAKDTLDEVILGVLMQKQGLADAIMNWAKAQREKIRAMKFSD